MNEAGEWIFSDEAHAWMDEKLRAPSEHNYQRAVTWFRVQDPLPRYGWEYGLFGFKHADSGGEGFSWRPPDE